jgi:hypothetical protein
MKKLIVLAAFLAGTFILNAQGPFFEKGDRVINLGIGITNYGMLSVSAEQGVFDGILDKGAIGVGIYAGAGYRFWGLNSARGVAGVRGTFHYPFIDKLDTYLGIGGGLEYTYWASDPINFWPDFDGFLGARYYFSDKLTLFCELGASLGYLTGGISFKL